MKTPQIAFYMNLNLNQFFVVVFVCSLYSFFMGMFSTILSLFRASQHDTTGNSSVKGNCKLAPNFSTAKTLVAMNKLQITFIRTSQSNCIK